MSDVDRQSELHEQNERDRFDFLRTDVALCRTFAEIAKTELLLGEPEAAQQALTKAEDGYATITRFLPSVRNADDRDEIEQGLNLLRTTLDKVAADFGRIG